METGMCICTVNNNVVYFLQKHVYEQLRNHFFKATISSSLLFKVASSLVRAHWGMTLTAVCCFQFKKRYWFCKLPCIRPQIELSNTFVYDSKMSTGGISARNSHLSQGGEWHWSHLKFTRLILYFLRILGPGDKKKRTTLGSIKINQKTNFTCNIHIPPCYLYML